MAGELNPEAESDLDAPHELDIDQGLVPLGVAAIRRAGSDVTVVATALMVQRALDAADQLAAAGISVEVVDPRTLVPSIATRSSPQFRRPVEAWW